MRGTKKTYIQAKHQKISIIVSYIVTVCLGLRHYFSLRQPNLNACYCSSSFTESSVEVAEAALRTAKYWYKQFPNIVNVQFLG